MTEIVEATRVTLKMLDAWYAGVSNPDRLDNMCFPDARAIIAKLIASKDGEIEKIVKRESETVDQLETALSKLATLRAENKRLREAVKEMIGG